MAGGSIRTIPILLVAFALVTAGASPACKFISGEAQPLAEHAAHNPNHHGGGEDTHKNGHGGHQAADPCAFCVAFHVNKIVGGAAAQLALPSRVFEAAYILPAGTSRPAPFAGSSRARAPPFPA